VDPAGRWLTTSEEWTFTKAAKIYGDYHYYYQIQAGKFNILRNIKGYIKLG
jgi:hypothetical protein